MRERLAQLKKLTTEALVLNCKKVRDKERKSEVALIAFLSELRSRCGFLDYGYNSIFTFCQQELGLEDGPSYLRMQVAKVCQRFPQILEELESGRLSLSSAAKLSPVLTYDNVDELLTRCAGKKVREVALIVGELKPERPVSSGIYPIGSKKKEKSVPLDLCKNNSIAPSLAPSTIGEKSKVGDKADSSENVQVKANLEEQFFNFRFVAGKQLREKLLRLAEVMNVANMELNLAEILEESVDLALHQKDPQLKEERRKVRLQKKKFAEKEQEKDEGKKAKTKEEQNKTDESSPKEKVSRNKGVREQGQGQEQQREKLRYIPAKIRAQVLERAGYQCEKVGVNEIRCLAKTCLEIDHIAPYARGGNHAISNLQVLCKAHNSNKAKQEFGYEFIAKKILANKLAGCFASNS